MKITSLLAKTAVVVITLVTFDLGVGSVVDTVPVAVAPATKLLFKVLRPLTIKEPLVLIFPLESTWKASAVPTVNKLLGVLSPIPTLPPARTVIFVVPLIKLRLLLSFVPR